jgi:biopolymer transport protein ExbB
MKAAAIIGGVFILSVLAYGRKDVDETQQKIAMIEQLRTEYRQAQDELQSATARRWAARQRQVEKLERNKTEIDNVRRDIDRAHTDLARVREEYLAREQALTQENVRLDEERERFAFLGQIVGEKFDKTKKAATDGFPLDGEQRLAAINAVERGLNVQRQPAQAHEALARYFLTGIEESAQMGIGRKTILVSGNQPVAAQVLRIGNAFAYAFTPDSRAYALTSTGRLGENAWDWTTITNEELTQKLGGIFPSLVANGRIETPVPVDIIQNTASQTLIAGKEQSMVERFWTFCIKGGLTMIPLAVIVLWAALLIVMRLFYFMRAHNHDYRFINRALNLLEAEKSREAETYAKKEKGGLARILQTCLEHSRWTRSSAERAVRELLLKELPRLDKHLDTLAALAGAAPLLGLLGTVTGMIRMFEAITRFGTADPKLLAGGISEALVTTMVGLSIAIPLLLLHTLLSNTRNRIQSDMELYAMSILNRLWPEKSEVSAR